MALKFSLLPIRLFKSDKLSSLSSHLLKNYHSHHQFHSFNNIQTNCTGVVLAEISINLYALIFFCDKNNWCKWRIIEISPIKNNAFLAFNNWTFRSPCAFYLINAQFFREPLIDCLGTTIVCIIELTITISFAASTPIFNFTAFN